MGIFKRKKKKKKGDLIASSLAEPVENVGGRAYTNWGIISILILVLTSLGSIAVTMNMGFGNKLILYGEIATVAIGSIIVMGYMIYKKRKRETHRRFYAR